MQGTIPAPVALALWPLLRCRGRFGQGRRAAFLTFGGTGSRPQARGGRGQCGGPALGGLGKIAGEGLWAGVGGHWGQGLG